MDYILHIDTSADIGTVAISGNGSLLEYIHNEEERNHAASINLNIDKVLKLAGIKIKDLKAISVCGGPGSYTGLRIGLSTAKAICYTQDIPLILENRLTLMASAPYYKFQNQYNYYFSILQARAGEYYIAGYNNEFKEVLAPSHKLLNELPELLIQNNDNIYIIGEIYDELLPTFNQFSITTNNDKNIEIESWSKHSYLSYNCKAYAELNSATPYYLKQVYTHNSKKNNIL